MASYNKSVVIGNLGADPERRDANGTTVVNFSIATKEVFTAKDGTKKDNTEWHKIVVWGKMAENCATYLRKGSCAMVEGKLQTTKYQNKQGHEQYSTQIVASNVQFLSSPQQKGQVPDAPPAVQSGLPDLSGFSLDDIPF